MNPADPIPVRPVSRRDFLRRTGASAVGAVAGGLTAAAGLAATSAAAATASASLATSVARSHGLRMRRLGRTELMVSEIALGGGSLNETRMDLLRAALDAGINLWDTAPCYGEGASEEAIGRLLSARGARDRVILLTKDPGLDHDYLAGQPDSIVERALASSVEASLRRLRTDAIDIYACRAAAGENADAAATGYPQLRRALDRLRDAGKIRWLALATDDAGCASAARTAIAGGMYDVVMTVLNAAALDGDFRQQVNGVQEAKNRLAVERAVRLERAAAAGVTAVYRGPRARLRRRSQEAPAAEDMSGIPELAAAHDVGLIAVRAAHTRFVPPELDPVVMRRFGRPGLSRHQSLYRWVLDRPEIASVAVGMQTSDHLREALVIARA